MSPSQRQSGAFGTVTVPSARHGGVTARPQPGRCRHTKIGLESSTRTHARSRACALKLHSDLCHGTCSRSWVLLTQSQAVLCNHGPIKLSTELECLLDVFALQTMFVNSNFLPERPVVSCYGFAGSAALGGLEQRGLQVFESTVVAHGKAV